MPERFRDSRRVIYAIDYGTSNSLIAAVDEKGQVMTLPIDPAAPDPTVFRSVLYFPHQDLCYYGHRATEEYNLQEGDGRLIRSIKKYLPSTTYLGSYIENRVVKLEDLIGYFLLEMRRRANELIGRNVDEVILGRPAKFSFDPSEDKMAEYRLKKAAEIAGFKSVEFLAEPVAAAYDLKESLTKEVKVLVVDLGGGTSDFSVVRFSNEKFDKNRDILAIGGISQAGDAIDGQFMKNQVSPYLGANVSYKVPMGRNIQKMPSVLAESLVSPADIVQLRSHHVMGFFKKVKDWAISREDMECLERLVVLVEDNLGFRIFEQVGECKGNLGRSESSQFSMLDPGIEVQFNVTREQFANSVSKVTSSIVTEMLETLKSSRLSPQDIDLVYCTGGTSKLFCLQELLAQYFPNEKIAPHNFFHSVIQGLAQEARGIYFK